MARPGLRRGAGPPPSGGPPGPVFAASVAVPPPPEGSVASDPAATCGEPSTGGSKGGSDPGLSAGCSLLMVVSPGGALAEHLAESSGELEVPFDLDLPLEPGLPRRQLLDDHPSERGDVRLDHQRRCGRTTRAGHGRTVVHPDHPWPWPPPAGELVLDVPPEPAGAFRSELPGHGLEHRAHHPGRAHHPI